MTELWRQEALALLGQAVPVFALILVRTAGMLQQAPIIGSRTVPVMARAGITVALSLMYFLSMKTAPVVPHQLLPFLLAAVTEFGLGYLLGMSAMLVFYAFQSAGEMVATATGLSMMTTLNPSIKAQSSDVGLLFFYLSQTAFIALGGHLVFLSGYFQSFELVPLGGFHLNVDIWNHAGFMVISFFFIVIQISMPAIIVMFLVDFGLGIINRSSPSVSSILQLVQGIKPSVGFLILILMIPNVVTSLSKWADKFLQESQAISLSQAQPTPAPGP